ncbi:MAG: DUF2062 domain-containing protein [bacterium]|nr:DUF2062 domain-containing protein [bacterium]
MIKHLIVIPTYNNKKRLSKIVEGAISTGFPVLVVNDGSTDGAMETIKDSGAQIIGFESNRGKGAAILCAAAWAEEEGYSHIVTIDADGQHDPKEAPGLIEESRKHPFTIVVGKRNFDEADVPKSSRFGRWWSNLWCRITTGHSIGDSQSGFRAYPVEALRRIKCMGHNYDFEVEILVRGVWAGLKIIDHPISVNYSAETKEASHFDPFYDNVRISKAYTRLVIRHFLPLPHKIIFKNEEPSEEERLSLKHPARSLRILLKENTTPREIVYASMLGILLGTLPLIAIHSVSIVFAATRLRLNRLIALNISHICAPPVVPAIAIEAGYFIRNGKFLTEFNYQTLGHEVSDRLLDYVIGATFIAPFLTIFTGIVVYILILIYQIVRPQKNKEESLG